MSEWSPSGGLKEALICAGYVLSHPSDFPEGVVNALKKLSSVDKFGQPKSPEAIEVYKKRFDFEGFIITLSGTVGIVPDCSPEVREEWMTYWRRVKSDPFFY